MCEINPAHKKFFRLEVFTSDSKMTKEAFEMEAARLGLIAEMALNETGKFRWHIHEIPE